MLNGAEIILVPNACDMNEIRLQPLSVRAFENMVGDAMTKDRGDGPLIISAWLTRRERCLIRWSLKQMRLRASGWRNVILISYADRERETWGNVYRKPKVYNTLVEKQVESPFQRRTLGDNMNLHSTEE